MSTHNLRGGVSGSDNGAVLEEARRQLAARKEVRLHFPSAAVKKEDGRMDSRELADYVNDLASGAYEFVLNVARPFLRKMERELVEIGEEIKFDQCEDGEGKQTKQECREDYESTLLALQLFSPQNDGVLREEAEITGRQAFVEALCLRIRQTAQIALLVDGFHHAKTKAEMEDLLATAEDGIDQDIKQVFAKNSEGPIRAFGQNYGLTADVFGRYHEFAREKLAEAINSKARDLSKAHKAEIKRQMGKVFAEDDSLVSPEELLFGNSDDVNEKTALLAWKFRGHDNVVKLRRSADRLYVMDAVGSPLPVFKEMQDKWDKPFISLRCILAKDGEHLCPEKMDFIPDRTAFSMAHWIRTAAGTCIPSRLLPDGPQSVDSNGAKKPKSAKERPVKTNGELLTDQEFLFFRGFGEYDLVYAVDFHYEPKGEDNQPDGRTFNITEQAVARVERKDAGGKDKIALKSASTEELVRLLEAGGAEAGHEYFEGMKGVSLPITLRLGISQAFRRLKLSEAEAS